MILVTSKANPAWRFPRTVAGPKRIVHVPRRFVYSQPEPVETAVLELAKQQVKGGMEPVIIAPMMEPQARHQVLGGVRVHQHSQSYRFFGHRDKVEPSTDKVGGGLHVVPIYQSLIQEPDVRLFHSHTLDQLGGQVLSAAQMRGRPFVASIHGDEPLSRTVLEAADRVVVTGSQDVSRLLGMIGHDRVTHLTEGVDCAQYTVGDAHSFRSRRGIPFSAPVIGVTGDLRDAQQMRTLLETWAALRAAQPTLHLVLMGNDDPAVRQALEQHRVGPKVHLLRQEEIVRPDAWHASDIQLALSTESSCAGVLQAWAAGKTVIASASCQFHPYVRDAQNGLLFDAEEPDAVAGLVARIKYLFQDEALRQRLGEAGHAEALANHDWSVIGRKMEQVYQTAEEYFQQSRLLQHQQGRKAA